MEGEQTWRVCRLCLYQQRVKRKIPMEIPMYTKEKIYGFLQETLVSLFEIDASAITPEANLYEDLDIDSIDAVDLTVKLKEFTGRRIQPSDFKQVRTVQDVVDAVYDLLNRPEEIDGLASAGQD
ncbi:acyl carrier protein [Cellvibrio japonicus Ueda107]|uniref:Acyl carrier protein n=3 Tax=Cellvibrio japonicus TaxID=155077 RepID=B3PFJ2_CELJU|nr:acyl carrier protein [Cellvibrio japonicus Ueda107]